MKFIVDTNILLTFFWVNSFTRKILLNRKFEFSSPVYALKEINSYKSEIIQKAKISLGEFKELRRELAICVEFIPLKEYQNFLIKAINIPDKKDIDFIALALKLNFPLWSNDKDLKEQSIVSVLSTKEFIEFYSL